jgi:hypothetical protein
VWSSLSHFFFPSFCPLWSPLVISVVCWEHRSWFHWREGGIITKWHLSNR